MPLEAPGPQHMIHRRCPKTFASFILDIRNNGGGLFSAITEVAQRFLKEGEVVCTLTGKKDNKKVYRAEGQNHYTDMPMVVLIDGKTANGAEILVASLGDNKRAVLVGETTAGLDEIQTLFPLGGGSYFRMRTALVSRPNGKRIDEHGIAPDREVVLTEEERTSIFGKWKWQLTATWAITRMIVRSGKLSVFWQAQIDRNNSGNQ